MVFRMCVSSLRTAQLLVLLLALLGCAAESNEYVEPPPPQVTIATPVMGKPADFLEENGIIEANAVVEVRARVAGFIEEVSFQPGQEVKAGDVLYRIEDDLYVATEKLATAAVAQATAAIATAEAAVSDAEATLKKTTSELDRQQKLYDQKAGSEQALQAAVAAQESAAAAVSSATASVAAAKAMLQGAEAELERAKLDVAYTTVTAPIDGFVTKTAVKEQNLVEQGTPLATIIDQSQVFINFSVSDRKLLEFAQNRVARNQSAKLPREEWAEFEVTAKREVDEDFTFQGQIDYVDQAGVDVATGTLGLRAAFQNPTGELLPGLFVKVRVTGPEQENGEAWLLPELTISRDQLGSFVLTVNAQGNVERTLVTVGRRVDGWAVIETGLTEQSQVIIEGLQRARPGQPVETESKPLENVPEILSAN